MLNNHETPLIQFFSSFAACILLLINDFILLVSSNALTDTLSIFSVTRGLVALKASKFVMFTSDC